MTLSNRSLLLLTASFLFIRCTQYFPADTDDIKVEIEQTERDFARMAEKQGIGTAFLEYAADEAILIRNSKAVEGRAAIREYFGGRPDEGETLTWKPRKIEVSVSGELAYSFGDFTFTRVDDNGEEQILNGNYCTIWERQSDGSWKYVMD